MVREELRITVPNLFRCPISLDVMRSPVSLCTGVTYDRSSIQPWLESGHDTCPATNQPLPSKDFVPNLTLHRLINLWIQTSDSRRTDLGSPSASIPPPAITKPEVRDLIGHIADGARLDAIEKIAEFASYSEENRRFLVNIDRFVEVIVSALSREGVKIQALESAIRILDLILAEKGVKEQIVKSIFSVDCSRNCFDSIVLVLRNGRRLASKVESVRVLESIALTAESRRSISEKQNILHALIHLLRSQTDKALRDAALSCLIAFSVNRSVKTQLVQFGIVPVVSGIIADHGSASSSAEKALKMAHVASGTAEGRRAISEDPNCAVAIMERLMKVSQAAKDDGVAVLWSLCFAYRDEKVKERLGRSNGVTKLLLVMQSDVDAGVVKRMCVDLVKVLRAAAVAGSSGLGLGSYETKTTHIRPY